MTFSNAWYVKEPNSVHFNKPFVMDGNKRNYQEGVGQWASFKMWNGKYYSDATDFKTSDMIYINNEEDYAEYLELRNRWPWN